MKAVRANAEGWSTAQTRSAGELWAAMSPDTTRWPGVGSVTLIVVDFLAETVMTRFVTL